MSRCGQRRESDRQKSHRDSQIERNADPYTAGRRDPGTWNIPQQGSAWTIRKAKGKQSEKRTNYTKLNEHLVKNPPQGYKKKQPSRNSIKWDQKVGPTNGNEKHIELEKRVP